MLLQKSISQKFLDRFTLEIILNIKNKLEEKQNFRKEEQRRNARVELEKLKQKFENYGEKKLEKNIIPIYQKPVIISKIEQPKPIITPPIQVSQQPLPPPIKQIIKPRPIQLQPGEIDFGRILPIIRDPNVTYIECQGEEKNIIIKREENTISTQIILKKDEINKIIKSFSEKAQIPLIEGMLNARVDGLEISAVVSEVISPSFILKKLNIPTMTMPLVAPANVYPSQGLLQGAIIPEYARPQNQQQNNKR